MKTWQQYLENLGQPMDAGNRGEREAYHDQITTEIENAIKMLRALAPKLKNVTDSQAAQTGDDHVYVKVMRAAAALMGYFGAISPYQASRGIQHADPNYNIPK